MSYRTKVKSDAAGTLVDLPLDAETLQGNGPSAFVSATTSRTANTVLAAPNGSAGAPTFRSLVKADLPSLTAADVGAMPNYTLNISTSAGNPRQVKFVRINYTTFDGNNAAYFKISAACSHGNGTSYTFMEDIIIGCNSSGTATCEIYKQVQNTSTYTIDGVTVYFGDVFWTVDTTNKLVDFYIIGGQYATLKFTKFTAIGNTVTDTSKIIQSSGSATLYSSGTRNWASGNGAMYARTDGIVYTTTAPTSANTNGNLKVVVLSSEPATRYSGYLYIVTGN